MADWREVPPVPAAAFKHLRLFSVEDGRAPEKVFVTSGTTRGAERRGEHAVASLELYHAAALPWFRAHLLPDGAQPDVLALVPSPADAPEKVATTAGGGASIVDVMTCFPPSVPSDS